MTRIHNCRGRGWGVGYLSWEVIEVWKAVENGRSRSQLGQGRHLLHQLHLWSTCTSSVPQTSKFPIRWYSDDVILLCFQPTHGNKFQTNQPEHESDDRAGYRVTSVCVANDKNMTLQRQIWSAFVPVLWCSKTKLQTGLGYWFLWEFLWDMIFKIYWQFWHSFFKNSL